MKSIIEILGHQRKSGDLMRKIFSHCINNKKSTIPEIARSVGYSAPAVAKQINELLENGYIIDYGKTENKEGRPANLYGIDASAGFFVGVVLHHLSFNIGIMNLAGEIIKHSMDKSFRLDNTRESVEIIVEYTQRFIRSICADNNEVTKAKILNINFGISGRVNPESGYSFSMFNTGEVPLADVLREKLQMSVSIDNDTRAMAYGEYSTLIKESKFSNMLFLNVGYGVGLGIIIDGKLYQGSSGYAGELGHTSVFGKEVMCHCGKIDCLETEASGRYIIKELYKRIADGSDSILAKKIQDGKTINIYDFIDAVNKREDPLCLDILEKVSHKLGRQVANMINIFNPEKIVVGGLLSHTGRYLFDPLLLGTRKYALTLARENTEITLSSLQLQAGIIGSCLLARDKIIK